MNEYKMQNYNDFMKSLDKTVIDSMDSIESWDRSAKIVPFNSRAYSDKLHETADKLQDLTGELFGCALELALAGKWRDWDNEQPIGTIFEFTEEMLCDTGDKNVDMLMDAYFKVKEVNDLFFFVTSDSF
ncbi:MAG: hypothetical protein LBR50_05940 [Tannerella sp.]|jgi:hypothetical protein|nr:hypothetical protein [Tannerella sp.]